MTVLTEEQWRLYREMSDWLDDHPDTHDQSRWYWRPATGEECTTLSEIERRNGPLAPPSMEDCGRPPASPATSDGPQRGSIRSTSMTI